MLTLESVAATFLLLLVPLKIWYQGMHCAVLSSDGCWLVLHQVNILDQIPLQLLCTQALPDLVHAGWKSSSGTVPTHLSQQASALCCNNFFKLHDASQRAGHAKA